MKIAVVGLWYIFFGAIHELTHVLVASLLTTTQTQASLSSLYNFDHKGDQGNEREFWTVLFRTLLLRQFELPSGDLTMTNSANNHSLIRHSGWIVSVLLMLCMMTMTKMQCRKNNKKHDDNDDDNDNDEYRSAVVLAATVTALEAVSTDLLGIGCPTTSPSSNSSSTFLYCGNFGIILLHEAWCQKGGKSALDVLEKMVEVTMMRGAQSGGTICFTPQSGSRGRNKKYAGEEQQLRGIRSRVVNKKRTDLSRLVRSKIQRDVRFPVSFLSGHTRFATSSKATFEGTHPQQWTPPTTHLVYDFHPYRDGNMMTKQQPFVPKPTRVENYVTHNGDFDFYSLHGITYNLHAIQEYLSVVLGHPMPAPVDSCAVAGMVDLLRTQGSFALSTRYVLCLGLKTSRLKAYPDYFPEWRHFLAFDTFCQERLKELLLTAKNNNNNITFQDVAESKTLRAELAKSMSTKLEVQDDSLVLPFDAYLTDEEGEASIPHFCRLIVDAFFDNDLFWTTQTFLKNAKGSFGLCFTSSLDAKRQLVLAARGQTMSVAFYPGKGLICYGSEQAAVKAGLAFPFPGRASDIFGQSHHVVDGDALRLDLDDLNGEVVVLDWGASKYATPPVSVPNRRLVQHKMMNEAIDMVIYHESKATNDDPQVYHRMTKLTGNEMILPLPESSEDPVLTDIQDIPRVCQAIQYEWSAEKAHSALNRHTAFNLSRCLRKRLEKRVQGNLQHPQAIDILLTGCEVSLWLAEQFASDLKKAFPNLGISAVSSNKLLGLYGQDISVPSLGFPDSPQTHQLDDTIIIVVSHSGGTFAPLSCSNLLQSKTRNLFVVTSEWDTQISKQLRAMDVLEPGKDEFFNSRVFTTDVGMRPAEPCSVSAVATHQLLTNLYMYICVVILSDPRFKSCSGAVVSEQDLQILEKCNRQNIAALSEIISSDDVGEPYDHDEITQTTKTLKRAGDLWANHVLENARAYVLMFLYVFGTVISGYPLVFGIATAFGYKTDDWVYLIRLFDAMVYLWMPQINILLLRLLQGRNLRHRMVGRTVVIGDIPWVAQAAEAFLSKLFACSYSIAGLNVLSGNPADHFVHRHTHRVVRGSLVVCGRPDGRLSALSTAEASVCLSVNQASSIQSWGGTCESITIGHNPVKLDLTQNGIFLKRKRPLFLCERMLVENDMKEEKAAELSSPSMFGKARMGVVETIMGPVHCFKKWFCRRKAIKDFVDSSSHTSSSLTPRVRRRRSAAALIGAYANFEETTTREYLGKQDEEVGDEEAMTVDTIIVEAIEQKKFTDEARNLFSAVDLDGDGFVSLDEFMKSPFKENSQLTDEELRVLYDLADADRSGRLDYREFLELMKMFGGRPPRLPPTNRNKKGIIQINPTREKYFGETIRRYNSGKRDMSMTDNIDFWLARRQHFSQELYETRIASMQRFVAMTVMFHQMGKRVQEFFPWISCGFWGYRMDRTHSIMRIATTASPVSGADVKQRMRKLQLTRKIHHSIKTIECAYSTYRNKRKLATGDKTA